MNVFKYYLINQTYWDMGADPERVGVVVCVVVMMGVGGSVEPLFHWNFIFMESFGW